MGRREASFPSAALPDGHDTRKLAGGHMEHTRRESCRPTLPTYRHMRRVGTTRT